MTSSTEMARTLVEALVAAGVREVVLCPGSRSSPMAYAVAAAERAGHLRLHVRVDERSAGFLALGLAKVSRRPAVVITTSGTAVANLHPAVLEAHHALVPLIVLSCDRPAELRGTGANQTTVQPGIFGGVCRDEADVAPGAPSMDLVGLAWDAVAAARGELGDGTLPPDTVMDAVGQSPTRVPGAARHSRHVPGPVHLNVQFREPLVPDLDDDPSQSSESKSSESKRQVSDQKAAVCSHSTGEVAELPGRSLVVLGDMPTVDDARRVLDWAAAHAFPVLAEPFGPHARPGVVRHGVLVAGVASFVERLLPEAVVVAGRPTLSRAFSALIRRPETDLVVVDTGLEFDVPGRPTRRVPLAELDRLSVGGVDRDRERWLETWLEAGHAVGDAVDSAPPVWPTGPAIARVVADALPDGSTLFLGSSNSPRDLDVAATFTRDAVVVASRGLAGIDGCVSTAIGLALSADAAAGGDASADAGADAGVGDERAGDAADGATYALMGDLTFLHDTNGLLIGPDESMPDLTIVVANDDGGGIFTTLEPGEPERAEDFERLFGTPTGADLSALCRAHGIRHQRVDTAAELRAAIAARPDGIRVVEVTVDRTTHRAERARLRALAAAALAG